MLRPTLSPVTTRLVLGPLGAVLLFAGCSGVNSAHASRTGPRRGPVWKTRSVQHGKASYYSIRCNGGTQTASGERLRNEALTAAHKTLPMGTKVRVTNLANGKSEVVRINDRGPYIRGRVIDVTVGVAKRLDFLTAGVVPCKVEVLEQVEAAEQS